MARESKLKVRLISHTKDPEQIVAAAIRQCYSSIGANDLTKEIGKKDRARLIKQILASGHTSTLEHASFTFAIEGLSRITEIHLIRHRIASFSIQSGRYVRRSKVGYLIPKSIKELQKSSKNGDKRLYQKYLNHLAKSQTLYDELLRAGLKEEDARFCQPQSLQVKAVVTMNARSLLNFFRLRCCQRAQWEVRDLAWEMLRLVKRVAPNIFSSAGPSCLTEKICWEGKFSCGLWKTIKGAELKQR